MQKKTVFTKSLFDFEKVEENNNEVIGLHKRINDAKDERSIVIFCSLISEYYLDKILKCFFINYKELESRSDYTFSFKISLLKSLNFIPSEIIQMIDIVRKIRNKFAHELLIEKISDLNRNLTVPLTQIYKKEHFAKKGEVEYLEMFKAIFTFGYSYLRTYEKNFKLLREKIESEEFQMEMEKLNNERMNNYHDEIVKKGPLEIIEKGDQIIERYSNSYSIIRNKKCQ